MFKNKELLSLKQQKIILFIFIPLALIVISFVVYDIFYKDKDLLVEEKITYKQVPERVVVEPSSGRGEIPVDSFVPEVNTELSEEQRQTIALPERAVSTNPSSNSETMNRRFNFIIENDNIINQNGGKNINVYSGDQISITFTAIDKDYDIAMPDYFSRPMIIKQGASETVRFQAIGIGSSVYYCIVCGGEDSQASGLIVSHLR